MDLLKTTYIIGLSLILGLVACQKDEDQKYEIHPLPAYHSIVLDNSFEVELIEQNEFELEIIGDESFVEKVKFDIQDSTLSIKNEKKFKWTNPGGNIVKLIIKGKGLKSVHANESCQIRSINAITTREFGIVLKSKENTASILVDNEVFYYWNNFPCGGKLTVSGKTNELKLWNVAIMSVDASALLTSYAVVENGSKGDCIVNVSNHLDYKIEGEGDIVLYGNPSIINDMGSSNSGSLIQR